MNDEEDESERPSDEEHEGERVMSRADGASILREIADGVETGRIEVGGERGFAATIPERFELEVEYEVEADEAELEIELEWPMEGGEAVSAGEE
ncbi:amphi-Trp domain-containing protein [Halovivax gelatinilyticus]|uniref:amphi-Trp domain-containing protein n=1 Tax=Halovivax gelatinilyticus TaxID=2961597 RepID=UPI0020CA795B|nr:amphi-Trp domain-containing protein [Halovivax gelatinilyticus]